MWEFRPTRYSGLLSQFGTPELLGGLACERDLLVHPRRRLRVVASEAHLELLLHPRTLRRAPRVETPRRDLLRECRSDLDQVGTCGCTSTRDASRLSRDKPDLAEDKIRSAEATTDRAVEALGEPILGRLAVPTLDMRLGGPEGSGHRGPYPLVPLGPTRQVSSVPVASRPFTGPRRNHSSDPSVREWVPSKP